MSAAPADCPIQLVDATEQLQIGFRHTDGGSDQQYITELMVGGVALFDFDCDGWIDIYFLNGAPPRNAAPPAGAPGPSNALYRNSGDGTFRDVTEDAGVGDRGHGLGVAVGDYDNDGDPDLYVSNYGPNVLYRNEGDGTFRDVTQQAGVGCGDQFGAGACFLDIDGDGDLDLYAAQYVDFSYARHTIMAANSFPYPPGPGDYRALPDRLFRNNGDGSFADISGPSGIAALAGPSMGMICLDFDDDGDSDVFVCNDGKPNYLFQNDGHGKFQELGLLAGLAYNGRGDANGSMGADCGDYDNDGRLDLFMTDYTSEMPVLYRNLGGGLFEDATSAAGAGAAVFPHTKWGTCFADFDNDGDRDLFVANGHFLINIPEIDQRTAYRVRNCLMMNSGNGRFADVSQRCGDGLAIAQSSRGVGADDLDNDGDIDLAILNANGPPSVLRNECSQPGHWLQLRLRGTLANRDGVGSRVRVVCGDLSQVAEVHSGRAYQSHFGTRLHFGLGTRDRIERIEVDWLGGGKEVFEDLAADQQVDLRQGSGRPLP